MSELFGQANARRLTRDERRDVAMYAMQRKGDWVLPALTSTKKFRCWIGLNGVLNRRVVDRHSGTWTTDTVTGLAILCITQRDIGWFTSDAKYDTTAPIQLEILRDVFRAFHPSHHENVIDRLISAHVYGGVDIQVIRYLRRVLKELEIPRVARWRWPISPRLCHEIYLHWDCSEISWPARVERAFSHLDIAMLKEFRALGFTINNAPAAWRNPELAAELGRWLRF